MKTAVPLDERMMKQALRCAARGRGRTFPNPSVGAVIYRGEQVLGRGYTRPPGGPHAEIVAIAAARRRHGDRALRGATIATTLEPCCFRGRTGPCTDAILEAELARVVVGCLDPHARVAGKGVQRLRRRGVSVATGILESDCREEHRGFLSVCERGRPFVSVKLATSLDGRIALANGASRWITSPAAREKVHRMRNQHDAVMVGSETALADDPDLSVRKAGRVLHRPIRILVDGRLRVPDDSKLFRPQDDSRTWLMCPERARGIGAARTRAEKVIESPRSADGYQDLVKGFRALAREGLTSVLVEGGGRLAAALFRAGLIDEVHWMLAPRLLGGDGREALGPLALSSLEATPRIENFQVARVGPDLHIQGRVTGRRRAGKPDARQKKGNRKR